MSGNCKPSRQSRLAGGITHFHRRTRSAVSCIWVMGAVCGETDQALLHRAALVQYRCPAHFLTGPHWRLQATLPPCNKRRRLATLSA